MAWPTMETVKTRRSKQVRNIERSLLSDQIPILSGMGEKTVLTGNTALNKVGHCANLSANRRGEESTRIGDGAIRGEIKVADEAETSARPSGRILR